MADPTFDVDTAHRWFAMDLNNATWTWLETHTEASATDPAIHAAHASYHHWRQVGGVINNARAASLVANVHAACGNGSIALALAHECFDLLDQAGDDATDWDLAFAHDSLWRALAALDDPGAQAQRATARRHGDAIADPASKQVFDDWFNAA